MHCSSIGCAHESSRAGDEAMTDKRRGPKYQQAVHDATRTMDNQMSLLAGAAARAWKAWADQHNSNFDDIPADQRQKNLDDAMRLLYQAVAETDIYMAGFKAGTEISE